MCCKDIEPRRLASVAPARIIDVRDPNEFHGELGHIPGAELVPLPTVVEAARDWGLEEPLVMVCRSGARSGRAAAALRRLGFRCVMNLDGGMVRYRETVRTTW